MTTRTLADHITTAERVVLNSTDFLERRTADRKWPLADVERERSFLADKIALLEFLQNLGDTHERSTEDSNARRTRSQDSAAEPWDADAASAG